MKTSRLVVRALLLTGGIFILWTLVLVLIGPALPSGYSLLPGRELQEDLMHSRGFLLITWFLPVLLLSSGSYCLFIHPNKKWVWWWLLSLPLVAALMFAYVTTMDRSQGQQAREILRAVSSYSYCPETLSISPVATDEWVISCSVIVPEPKFIRYLSDTCQLEITRFLEDTRTVQLPRCP